MGVELTQKSMSALVVDEETAFFDASRDLEPGLGGKEEQVGGSPLSRLEHILRVAQQRQSNVVEKFHQGFCHECQCVLKLVTCNGENFYCSKCGGMFVEQCEPNSEEARMFEDIEKRAESRMRGQRGGALYVNRNAGASGNRRRRVVRANGGESDSSARAPVGSNGDVQSGMEGPPTGGAGSRRSSTRNGARRRRRPRTARRNMNSAGFPFIRQLNHVVRMFNDSDDDSDDEGGNEPHSDDEGGNEPIVNIAQMIGRVLNGFVSGEGGEGIASDIRNYTNQEGLQALMSRLVSTGNVDNRCASKDFLEHLRKNKIEAKEVPSTSLQCPICQNPFVRDDDNADDGEPSGLKRTMSDSSAASSSSVGIAKLPCGHYFCLDCITPWLNSHVTCPVCRAELPTEHIVRNQNGTNQNDNAFATTSSSGPENPDYSEQRSGFMRARTDSLD